MLLLDKVSDHWNYSEISIFDVVMNNLEQVSSIHPPSNRYQPSISAWRDWYPWLMLFKVHIVALLDLGYNCMHYTILVFFRTDIVVVLCWGSNNLTSCGEHAEAADCTALAITCKIPNNKIFPTYYLTGQAWNEVSIWGNTQPRMQRGNFHLENSLTH